jgi:ribosomal protein S1
MIGTFEILAIDLEHKRIGVALVQEGWARAEGAPDARLGIVLGARLTGKVAQCEKFGVFVFLAPGRTGLIPLSETGVAKEGDVQRAFPVVAIVEVIVMEVDLSGRRIRLSEVGHGSARGQRSVQVGGAQGSSHRGLRDTRRQAALGVQVAREVKLSLSRLLLLSPFGVSTPPRR